MRVRLCGICIWVPFVRVSMHACGAETRAFIYIYYYCLLAAVSHSSFVLRSVAH